MNNNRTRELEEQGKKIMLEESKKTIEAIRRLINLPNSKQLYPKTQKSIEEYDDRIKK